MRFVRNVFFVVVVLLCFAAMPVFAAKDTLIVVNNTDASALDPIFARDLASNTICTHIYDGLVKLDNKDNLVPSLAEKWEILSPLDVKFHLRKDVTFHNGEKFTAHDVKYTIDRALSPDGVSARIYTDNIKSVDVEDDYTVVFHMNWPDQDFITHLTTPPFFIVNRKAIESLGEKYLMNPVGTGAFVFESWSKGDRLILTRNENYWGDKPSFKTLVHRAVPELSSRTIELESGATDIALFIGRNDIKRIEENPKLKLERHLLVASMFIGMNVKKAPFDNPKIREAIWCALDIPVMYKAVMGGVGELSMGMVPSTVKYYVPFQKEHKRDVERAKKLLEEAGVKGRLKVEIWMNENKERVDLMTIAQSMLEEVGIDAELKVMEMGSYTSAMRRGEQQIFVHGRAFSLPSPNLYLSSSFSTKAIGSMNYCNWSDPETDRMLDEARVEQDETKRAELYKSLLNYLEDLTAWIPVYTVEQVAGTQSYVKNFVLDSKGIYYFGNVTLEE